MFGLSLTEILLVALVALLVLGPNDLPRVMYHVGRTIRRISYIRFAFTQQFEDFLMKNEKTIKRKEPEKSPDNMGEDSDDLDFDVLHLPNENKTPDKPV